MLSADIWISKGVSIAEGSSEGSMMLAIMAEPQRGSIGAKESYISEDGGFADYRRQKVPMGTGVRY